MKRIVFAIIAVCASIMTVNAQNLDLNYKGYRGFADVGYSIGTSDYDFGRVTISTSHGYQFNPYIFLGAGVGLQFSSSYKTKDMDIALDERESKVDIPIFANIHSTFLKKKFSPFADLRAGCYVNNGGGLYFNLAVGCRMATVGKQGAYISLGYSAEKLEFETFDRFINYTSLNYTREPRKLDTYSINIKLGYEF